MAIAEADPGEYLDDEDRKLTASLVDGVADDMAGPVPDDIEDIAPDVAPAIPIAPDPAVAEAMGEAPPVAPDLPAAAPPGTPAAAIEERNKEAERLATGQAELNKEKAGLDAATADRIAREAQVADEDARLERAEYLERRQAAEQDLDAKIKRMEDSKITPPQRGFKSTLSVIFGGLGAAFRSAGGGDSKNTALANLQQQWENDTQIQKANIAAARDNVIAARTRLGDVNEGRRQMTREADARLVGKYNMAIRQGEAQLKNHGIPQAQLDADARILALRQGRDAALAKARQEEDAHALSQARAAALASRGTPGDLQAAQIRVMNARAAMLERKGKGGGGGGVKPSERRAQEKFEADKAKAAAETEVFDAATGESAGHAPSKSRAEHTSKRLEQLDVVKGDAQRLKQHIDEAGMVAPSVPLLGNVTEASRTRQALANKLVTDVSAFQNLGAISKDDKKIIDGVIGGGSSYVLGLNSKQIDELTGAIERAKSSVLRAQGIKPKDTPSSTTVSPTKAGGGPQFVVGQTLRLKSGPDAGKTVRIKSADGDYDVVSPGRQKMTDIKL